jgi:hypothetical protein
LDLHTHEHKEYSRNNGFVGTAQYVSVNAHLGDQQSRRDDLESVMYLLIRFLRGKLPWSGIHEPNREARHDRIADQKIRTTLDALCVAIPREFREIIGEIRKLGFDNKPGYAKIRELLRGLFVRSGFVNDGVFDWDDAAPIHKPLPSVYLRQCAWNFMFVNERQVNEKKEIVKLPRPRKIFLGF